MRSRVAVAVGFVLFASLAFAQVTLTVSSPNNNYSGPSPMRFVGSATTTSSSGMSSVALTVDNVQVFFQWGSSFSAYLWMGGGKHTVVATATDNAGNKASKTLTVRSTGGRGTVYNIDQMSNWQSDTGSDIGGAGGALSNSQSNQTSPSIDGNSRVFTLGGTTPYANAYWYNFVGGSKDAVNFVYDNYVAIDSSQNPQALELDVNQSFNHQRWVFGTQCNFKGGPPLGGYWNVWDGGTSSWQPTNVPCRASDFPSYAMQHIVWSVYRTGKFVHYVSVTINGHQHGVNLQFGNQPNWDGSDIDVSVQLDGDSQQSPYSVWIDKMNLTAW